MKLLFLMATCATAFGLVCGDPASAEIIFLYSDDYVGVRGTNGDVYVGTHPTVADFPFHVPIEAFNHDPGNSDNHARSDITLSDTLFRVDFDHLAQPTDSYFASSWTSKTAFRVTVPTDYTISGEYTRTAGTGTIHLGVELLDTSFGQFPGTLLFQSIQESSDLSEFTVSGTGTTGTLLPDRTYWWSYSASVVGVTDQTAPSASGYASIAFGSVPEPTSVVAWSSLGVMGLIAAWRRRRKVA